MPTSVQDLRYGLRMLAKSPGFTALVVLTLALGIGANTTIFSWINSTLLNPIPGATNTSRLVSLTRGGTVEDPGEFSYPDYTDLRDGNRSFSALIAFAIRPVDLTGSGKPERLWGTIVSANYFDVLGVRPILGRGFLAAEEKKPGGAPVVVLSYGLWRTHFGRERHILGQTISINQHPFTVVGVTSPAFQGSLTGLRSDLWVPLVMQQEVVSNSDRLHDRGSNWLMMQGRLAPHISRQKAQQEMNLLMRRIVERFPDSHFGHNEIGLYPLWRAPDGANAYFYILLPMLLAIAGVVLLLACANVANLLLVRAVSRRTEIAIRMSMGASRWRVIRQLLVESLLLALAGGGLAMLLTSWTAVTFAEFIPPTDFPVSLDVRVDRTVFLATLTISVLSGVFFGLLPALRSASMAPAAVLKEDTARASAGRCKVRLTTTLAVVQLALSLLLLASAGLFIRGFRRAQRFDPGFKPDHVLVASFDLFPAGYTKAEGFEFDRQLLAKLDALPGVQSASLADDVPLGFTRNTEMIKLEGYVPQPREAMDVRSATVGPDYLRTMGIPVLAGREFAPQDTRDTQQVAVVNQALVDRYWPHQDAIGKRLWAEGRWFTVIGVARNSNYDRLNEAPMPFLYLPLFQVYYPHPTIHARVEGEPLAVAPAVERAVHELNADLPVFDVDSLGSRLQVASANQRIAGTFVGAFGLLALILATVGIYGVIAYTARRRTHEIGIRVALGAERGDILRLMLGQGFRITVAGLAFGLLISVILTPFLRSQLFGVTTTDTLTYASVSVLLCMVALAACYIPARRAAKVDPMVALHYE
jgi:predicted permease